MTKIKIFLASSNELKLEREKFEIEIYRKSKSWAERDIFIHLDIWEDLSAKMSLTGSQSEYNKFVNGADLFVLLAYSKVGKYTEEEFSYAYKQFIATEKPFIFTYFKTPPENVDVSLDHFKQKLSALNHFYANFDDENDLWNQFNKELDKLEVAKFKEFKHNKSTIIGDSNIVIQDVTDSVITINVNNDVHTIQNEFSKLKDFLEKFKVETFIAANNIYNTGNIDPSNFPRIIGQLGNEKSLPSTLANELLGEGNGWTQNLKEKLLLIEDISVSDDPTEICGNYGWLIQVFLIKLLTVEGNKKSLYRFSIMADVYQASLRYLCYIQMAQILSMDEKPEQGIIHNFLNLKEDEYIKFDFGSLLITSTDLIKNQGFMPEIKVIVDGLRDKASDIFMIESFLNNNRQKYFKEGFTEDEKFYEMLDEYLTGLISWLKEVSFLAKYKLASMKDIELEWSLGTDKYYKHKYGDLNCNFKTDDNNEVQLKINTLNKKNIDSFTYSRSILLFNSSNLQSSMKNVRDTSTYISLTPFIIDKSAYQKESETPEIYYYGGYDKSKKEYIYIPFNKPHLKEISKLGSHSSLYIKSTNNSSFQLLDGLFYQFDHLLAPFKNPKL